MTPQRSIRLITEDFAEIPALDTAVSRALLVRASDGEISETVRLHCPGRIVAFGKRDTLEPGYPRAVSVATDRNFTSIERLAGGRAAVFTWSTIAFSWTIPDPDPRTGIYDRFRMLSNLMVDAFSRLGVPAEVGAIPGEYCPGEFSVHHEGRIKLMGVGQRLARNAAHVGGVVVVSNSDEVRDILVPVYEALGLAWEPSTAGALTDVDPHITWDETVEAITEQFATFATLVPSTVDEATLDLARRLAPEHLPNTTMVGER